MALTLAFPCRICFYFCVYSMVERIISTCVWLYLGSREHGLFDLTLAERKACICATTKLVDKFVGKAFCCACGTELALPLRTMQSRGVRGTPGASCSMISFWTLSWTPGADEHQERGGWIEGEHVVTKPYERREGGTDC